MMSDERPESEPSTEADDLVVRAKTDRAAFSLLYDRYYPLVSKYCLRRLLVRAVAEDVLSDVFLQVASHLPTFSGRTDTDFRRWLFRIATNAINAHLRQSRRCQELWVEAVQSGNWNPNGDPHTLSTEYDSRDWPAVYQALMELDERDRTIVMLRFFADCSHEEIATVVNAKPGAVRTALSRTLARLREKFKPPIAAAPTLGTPRQG
jgi:RNA polymerase sigma-70 factor (ECF subfamily)